VVAEDVNSLSQSVGNQYQQNLTKNGKFFIGIGNHLSINGICEAVQKFLEDPSGAVFQAGPGILGYEVDKRFQYWQQLSRDPLASISELRYAELQYQVAAKVEYAMGVFAAITEGAGTFFLVGGVIQLQKAGVDNEEIANEVGCIWWGVYQLERRFADSATALANTLAKMKEYGGNRLPTFLRPAT